MITNNVTRLLDSRKIPYTSFETPPEKIGAMQTASFLGVPPEIVFKTIVIKREKPGKYLLAVIPGPAEVDLKKLAALLGEKKLVLPTEKEAEQITGLQAGGISPLALLNKGFQVIVDSSAGQLEFLHISGGQRGLNLRLPSKPLIQLTQAKTGDICRVEEK
ncbi:MAG TPA: YbaK/EbsC family protein [Longilinea sp.]|nr:YbaK/EbsC family protein [Longilinea sp.]